MPMPAPMSNDRSRVRTPQWIGIEGKNFIATVDLGEAIDIKRVGANFMRYQRVGVYVPVILSQNSDAAAAYDDAVARLTGTNVPLRFTEVPKKGLLQRLFGGN